MATSREEN
jgi:hypothetical protein